MPSGARRSFSKKLLPDVDSLIKAHRELNPDGGGKRALGYLTRSGVVMLCAAWELYIEDLIVESVTFLAHNSCDPMSLPSKVKGKIAQYSKNDKHDFGVLRLANEGWRDVYINAAKSAVDGIHAPKWGNITREMENWISIEPEELRLHWRHEKEELNEFVALRGEIAHRGADAPYVRIKQLRHLKALIDEIVIDTDRYVGNHLRSTLGKRPWNNSNG